MTFYERRDRTLTEHPVCSFELTYDSEMKYERNMRRQREEQEKKLNMISEKISRWQIK